MLPFGVAMGITVMLMAFYTKDPIPRTWGVNVLAASTCRCYLLIAYVFLMIVGAMSGYFVVPMNALLHIAGTCCCPPGTRSPCRTSTKMFPFC